MDRGVLKGGTGMKKKIKDLTFEELFKLCEKYESCDKCPYSYSNIYCKLSPEYLPAKEEIFEQEVEL